MKRPLIKIAQVGLGPIGLETVKLAATRPWARIIGAMDIDPSRIGGDLGRLTGTDALRGIQVTGALDELCDREGPDLIFHTTVSSFRTAFEQLEPMAERGINVVSSCEELLFPQLREAKLARRLDALCQKTGARMVGTGVNPGFVMDVLPLCLTSVSRRIRAIRIERVVDAATRREPLQRKIGSGISPAEFRRLLREGRAGHAGLLESLALLAHGLGWRLHTVTEQREPVIAAHNIRTQFFNVRGGQTCGIHQRAEAKTNGRVCLSLDLRMYLGAADPHDLIEVLGDPPLTALLKAGVAGDQATVAALVNTAPRLLSAAPGLRLMTELALPRIAL